jgi:23S rRNA pseudouridine2605 synthase
MRLTVTRLIRLSFGPFSLGELQPGAIEEVKRRIIADQLGAEVASRLGIAAKPEGRRPVQSPPSSPAGRGKSGARLKPAPRRQGRRPPQ